MPDNQVKLPPLINVIHRCSHTHLYHSHLPLIILSNIIWRMLRKYFEQYESEEDQDYNPTKLEEAIYRQQHEKKKKKALAATSMHQLYQDTKHQYFLSLQKKVKTDQPAPNTLELAQTILSSESIKPNKRVVFAGKEFILNEDTGQLEIVEKKQNIEVQEQHVAEQSPVEFERSKTHIAYQYLNHVMRAIYNRSRKINSVGKSKLDWRGFVRQEGIEDKLKYNRKGGVIENMQFMKKANNLSG